MYIAQQFKENRAEKIAHLIKTQPLGTLISISKGLPFISHLPFLYIAETETRGKLIAHIARDNPQYQHLLSDNPVTVVFNGPDAYISPALYSSPGVPTWNYAVAHIQGTPSIINSAHELENILKKTTEAFENRSWRFDIAEDKKARLFDMIAGFEVSIDSIEAKFKLSQNRPDDDQKNIMQTLSASDKAAETELASFMYDYYSTSS